MFKVESSSFNASLEICKFDDWKGYGKISEKRKAESICVQDCRTRKRMKDELLYSPGVGVFEKCSNCSTVTEGQYPDHLDSVLNISNDDEVVCSLNIEETVDDICNSALLDFSENVVQDSLCNADAMTMQHSLFHSDQLDVFQRQANDALTSKSHLNGKIICILNTEDSEIPCNDDIFMEVNPFPSFRPRIATDSTDPSTSCADEKDSQQGPSAEKDPTLSSDFDSAHPHVGHTFEYESSDTKWMNPLDIMLGQDGVDALTTYSEMSLQTEVGTVKMIDSESMANNPFLSHKNSDGDDDLPNFCDIEAMIVRLDLEYAQGSCIISEVTRHQYNYSNRTIIRPDNTACSSLIRSMSSLSAFAIFYNRHFHYYVMKTEVTIGRSTDDTNVDIDLRKEGHDIMLSSRQATIKMETDGSFTFKNIGKSSISINGNSIAHGQVVALDSSCLIEISGMNFLFEINKRYVRQYLDRIIKKRQGFDASSTISRLVESKGNKKTCEKRKGRSIHVQYYRKRKRIKDDSLNSPILHFFEKSKNLLDHVTLQNEAQFSDAMFSDSLANKFSFEEADFVNEGDSANSSTVTEGDIICSLNTQDTMDNIPNSQLLDSQEYVLEDSLCNADASTLLVATPRIKCHSQSKNPLFYDDQQGVCHWEADVKVKSKSHLDSIQLSEGKFICLLNTEDSEIPRNDDIFVQTHPSPSVTPQITTDIIDQLFSADGKDSEQELGAGKYPAPSFTDIIERLSPKLAVKWKQSVDTLASYSEISLRTKAGSLNNPISDHKDCYRDGDPPRLSDTETLIHQMYTEYAEESYITSEVEMHQNIPRIVKVEPSGFTPLSATSRLDDLKRNKKTREKRKVRSIHIQYYRKRKRIKNYLFNSQDLRFFEKCNSSSTVTEGEYADHPEIIRSFATNDVVTNDRTCSFDPSFELKDDSADSSTVKEGDIFCSWNTEDTMDDNSDSQMPNSRENVLEDSLYNGNGTTLLVATPRIKCDEESKDSSLMEKLFVKHFDSVQLSDLKVICNLNTEDSEIPCNDDIFKQIHQSSVRRQIATDSIDPFSSADLYHEFDFTQLHVGYTFRFESFDTKCLHPIFGQPDKITIPVLIEDRMLTRDGLDTSATYNDMSFRTKVESPEIIYPESVDNYLSISDNNNSDSDDDLPCFSDIDALIHRIGLEYAEESYITSEVGRHQYNYLKRTTTRLEQTSLSSLQRAMSSLGALAVFYSRHFNYYIKKTEVTIGRSTKDTDVDIDLRKVGRANMISRRQATIKMETDGSFTLKNFGKSSISMNGDSVARGQVATLSSSCVIEISGMKFTFEINERHVRRYLDNIIKESQCRSRTFEWSPEDEP